MPKPSVDTLLADPDFQALDIEGKREILGDVSPSFKALAPESQNAALADISQLGAPMAAPVVPRGTLEAPSVGRFAPDRFSGVQKAALSAGGPLGMIISQLVGRPVTATEAASEAALEEIVRLPGQIGEVGLTAAIPSPVRLGAEVGEQLGVLPQGSLDAAIRSLIKPATRAPEIIEEALGVEMGPERAKFREPTAAAVGEIGAALFPPVAAAPEATIKAAQGAAALPGRLRAGVESLSSRGITRAPLEDAITRSTGITAQEGSLDLAPTIKTRILESGKAPKTAQAAVTSARKSSDVVINKALDGIKKAETDGLVFGGDSTINLGREQILFDFPSLANEPEEIDKILASFDYLKGNIKPTQGQGFLRELNSKYLGLENKNSPEASAYRAIRSSLSDQLDEIYKAATEVNESPYRDWGKLQDFINGVDDQIKAAQRVQGGKAEKGMTRVPTTKGMAKRVAETVGLRALVPREIEAVDAGIKRIFKEVKSLPKPQRLTGPELRELRAKYSPTPPVLPVSQTLEESIQQTILSLPREMRGTNERSIAEAILRSQSSP